MGREARRTPIAPLLDGGNYVLLRGTPVRAVIEVPDVRAVRASAVLSYIEKGNPTSNTAWGGALAIVGMGRNAFQFVRGVFAPFLLHLREPWSK